MPAFGIRIPRFALGLLAAFALVWPGFAQMEPVPRPPAPMPVPMLPDLPKVPVAESLIVPLNTPNTEILVGAGLPPLPGSVADDYARELSDREKFRTITWRGDTFTLFPNTLLWAPAMAVHRDPRLQFLALSQSSGGNNNLDTSIGTTMGLIRAGIAGADLDYQLDLFGVVHTRLGSTDLMAADYRFGIPITWRRGWWQGTIAYEHTSSHLGDKFILRTQKQILFYAKDEIVAGLGRIIEDQFRVYAHIAYAYSQQLPDPRSVATNVFNLENTSQNRSRADIGFEWYNRCATGFGGTPFVAANLEVRGDQNYEPNFRAQAGWLFRNPSMRLGNARFFVEYYNGNLPYGQFYLQKETYLAAGFGFDY